MQKYCQRGRTSPQTQKLKLNYVSIFDAGTERVSSGVGGIVVKRRVHLKWNFVIGRTEMPVMRLRGGGGEGWGQYFFPSSQKSGHEMCF